MGSEECPLGLLRLLLLLPPLPPAQDPSPRRPEALGELPAGTLDKLLIPRSKTELVRVLTYHAVDGSVQTGES